MTKRLVGGYTFRAETTRAINANRAVRNALARLLSEEPGLTMRAALMAQSAAELSDNLDALRELKSIAESSDGLNKREVTEKIEAALRANKEARETLKRIVSQEPGQCMTLLIAHAAVALGSNLEALTEIERLGSGEN